jgi:hypothetical protein
LSHVNAGVRCGQQLDPVTFAGIVRTMALDHHKWDAQVGDVAALAPFPLLLSRGAWRRLKSLAVALAKETVAIEGELARRHDLHARLGLHGALARALIPRTGITQSPAAARIMRFDFHPTADGWRASEVNSDVPGGFTESSRFAELVAKNTSEGMLVGDPGAAWIDAVTRAVPGSGTVALLSAPGWVEDMQVVTHLAARLRARGLSAHLASPHHLRWNENRARLESDFCSTPVDAVLRFYQAEWIAQLPCHESWMPLFSGGRTPVSNPGSAALTESKRLPLVWSELEARTDAWRSVLPETRDPREVRGLWRGRGDWILKPAFGNTGDYVTLRECTSRSIWHRRVLAAIARPRRWIAQRRFRGLAVESPRGPMHACVGVYVIDGRASGAYGRLSPSPVIDYAAIDAAVLVER